jgi:hypothetical protein
VTLEEGGGVGGGRRPATRKDGRAGETWTGVWVCIIDQCIACVEPDRSDVHR